MSTKSSPDELERQLNYVTAQDLMAAVLWLTKDADDRIPQSDNVICGFFEDLKKESLEDVPIRIREILSYVRDFDVPMQGMRICQYFVHPTNTRAWMTMRTGAHSLELFHPEEIEYIAELAELFRKTYRW